MEPICKTAATALFSFGLLFSIMLITFDSNLLSLSSWHLFQTFLQNKQKNNTHAQFDHNAHNGTIKKLRTPEEKSRSNIFEQNMAEVFRSRVEKVQLACRDLHGDSNMTRSNTWIIKSTLKFFQHESRLQWGKGNCKANLWQEESAWVLQVPSPLIIVDLSLNKRTSLLSDGVWDLGQDFLCAAQGSMGRTLGRGDKSQIDCCARPLIFFIDTKFQLLLGALWPQQYVWQWVSKTTGVQFCLNLGNWSLTLRRPLDIWT